MEGLLPACGIVKDTGGMGDDHKLGLMYACRPRATLQIQ